MKPSDIKNVVENFIHDSSYNGILIDGKRGIGKTYYIKQFDKKNHNPFSKPKIYYISIFGTETLSEVNTEIYRKVHPVWSFLRVGYKTISSSINAVAGLLNSSIKFPTDLDSILEYKKPKKIKNYKIIIFDDIERIQENLFPVFISYVYQLMLQGARIICVCSIDKFSENNKKIFDNYKEKIFDAIYSIKDTEETIFEKRFKEIEGFSRRKNLLKICENNLRMLTKAYLFFCRLKDKYKNLEIDTYNLSIVCCITTAIALSSEKNVTLNDNNINYAFNIIKEEFDETIAKNYMFFSKKISDFGIDYNSFKYVRPLLFIYFYNDDTLFLETNNMTKNNNDSVEITEKGFFYLSDYNKKIYFEEVVNYMNGNSYSTNYHVLKKIYDILLYSEFTFEDTSIDNLARNYCRSIDKITPSTFAEIKRDLNIQFFSGVDDVSHRVSGFYQKFLDKIKIHLSEAFNEKFIKNVEEMNLTNVEDLLSAGVSDDLNLEPIKKYLLDKNFCLPDLSGDITDIAWSFAHNIADLVRKVGLSEEFINYARKLVASDPQNESLKERLHALIRYKIGKNIEKAKLFESV